MTSQMASNPSFVTAPSPDNSSMTSEPAKRVDSSYDFQTMSSGLSENDISVTSQAQRPIARKIGSCVSNNFKSKYNGKRYPVTLLIFVSINAMLILSEVFIMYDSTLSRMLASIIVPITAFFIYEWIFMHSSGLTRKTRAFWDEKNILLTYQPRARFEGYKFQPDPPTPGPGLSPLLEGGCIGHTPQEALFQEEQAINTKRQAFLNSRDAHYANEFIRAKKGLEVLTTSSIPYGTRLDEPLIDAAAISPSGSIIDDVSLRSISPTKLPIGRDSLSGSADDGASTLSPASSTSSSLPTPPALAQSTGSGGEIKSPHSDDYHEKKKSRKKSKRNSKSSKSRSFYASDPEMPESASERKDGKHD